MTDADKFRGRVVTEKKVMYISSTSLQSAVRCPMQGYISKKLRLQRKGLFPAALAFGTAVHQAMEDYLTKGDHNFRQLWTQGYGDVELYFNKQEQSFAHLLETCEQIVEKMIEVLDMIGAGKPYLIQPNNIPTVECQDFVKISDDVVLVRTFDAILPVRDTPTVIDFKTAGRMYSEGMQDMTSEQLTAYMFPHNLKGVPQAEQAAFIVGTKTKSPNAAYFPTTRNRFRLKAFRNDITAIARMFREGNPFHNRGPFTCGSTRSPMCEYYDICYKTEPGSKGWRGLYDVVK